MSEFVTVARLEHVPPGTCRVVEVQETYVALCNVNGVVYALDNTCPHAGGPIGEGRLEGELVICPWHGWKFNVRTGERPENPVFRLARCEVRIAGMEIQIDLPLDF